MPDLQRRLSLFSLVMAVVTSTIGSGWLFAPTSPPAWLPGKAC